ncbi:alpha/beta hydrolase [Herbiconiux moechotypicola]|uniref:Alpha/beta hydrolase n=1 Tax=Herbiconiux moechotypicola TaxID=637393 RepID=A0ABN3DI85_9MICO|nr:alpha/beta hydrolase [Herbiconiux moechotypicola]MCS5729692.1 alpha/beta hydrolase [Herbiconiux moechotypicola]
MLRSALVLASVCAALVGCSSPIAPRGSPTNANSDAADPAAATSASPIAGLFDVGGGRKIYLECSGSGSPTVVFVGGLRAGGDYWSRASDGQKPVYPAIAENTRACTYDRPGTVLDGNAFSRSDPIEQPTTAAPAAADLQALLEAADVPGPYVLAAHSYGGMIARLFASAHPDEVVGLVLVDTLSEAFQTALSPEYYEMWKVSGASDPADIAVYPALERLDDDAVFDEMRAAPAISPMPVTVLSADVKYAPIWESLIDAGTLPEGTPLDLGEQIDRAQAASQQFQATLVPDETHLTETHSGHDIAHDNAALVIDAIEGVVADARLSFDTHPADEPR